MGYNPKIVYGITPVQSVQVTTNELSIIAINDFEVGSTVEFFNMVATFLLGQDLVLDTAGPLIFTAPFTHADVVPQAETGQCGQVVLPTYPATGKPFANKLVAVRNDSISGDGHRQTVWSRTEEFLDLTFNFVPWTELPNWTRFFKYALKGGNFRYYPDRTTSNYQTFVLDGTDFTPTYNDKSISKFSVSFRLDV